MLWVLLDKEDYKSPHSSVVQHKGKFQMEARGATAAGLQGSVKKALHMWKPGATTLRDLGVQLLLYGILALSKFIRDQGFRTNFATSS